MGNKFPIDHQFTELSKNDDIYAPANPYGYRYNISHPKINPLYWKYKERKKIPPTAPLSDSERMEFEYYIDKLIRKQA
jgi:hypothetical protein